MTSPKRPRLTEEMALLEDIRASAKSDGKPADFPTQVVTFLLCRQTKESGVREKELKIRQAEIQLERAKIRLQEDKMCLEKARFEIEKQEREQRLRSEIQERAVFMEVLKKAFNNDFGSL